MASGKLPQPIEGQTDAERLRQIAFSEWVLKTEKSELVEREQQRKQQELGAAARSLWCPPGSSRTSQPRRCELPKSRQPRRPESEQPCKNAKLRSRLSQR